VRTQNPLVVVNENSNCNSNFYKEYDDLQKNHDFKTNLSKIEQLSPNINILKNEKSYEKMEKDYTESITKSK